MACAVTRRHSSWERSSALVSSSRADSPLAGHVCLPFLTFVLRSSGVAMSATRDGELFKSPCAQLYLVGDGAGESLLMQSGRFAVVLFKNPVSQLGAVVAMVEEVQWPLGHDASVVKKEEGSFTFTLPGFLTYDLVLEELPSADLGKLEHILREYSNYGEPSESQSRVKEAEPLKVSDEQSSAGSSGRSSSEQRGDAVGSHMKRRMLRAHRMSAVVKVFSRSLARGAISAANHVERRDTAAGRHAISSDLNLAGVDAVAKVVEAVETGGRALLESIGSQEISASPNGTKPARPPHDAASTSGSTSLASPMWTLNKPGLLMLYRVISVSLAMHSGSSSSGSGSGSGRSGSSSSTEIRRFFSSPSFSSSSSGRSMSASPSRSAGAEHPSTALSLQPPPMPAAAAAGASVLPAPPPPPPPLFSESAPPVRQSSMPPPSGPPPLVAGSPHTRLSSSDCSSSSPFRIYRPRPTAGAPITVAPTPPFFIPRPPRFQPPPKS